MKTSLSIALLFIAITIGQWESTQSSCEGDLNDRKTALYAVASKNQSGHLITKFSANNLSAKDSRKFTVDVRSDWICEGKRQGIRIEGFLVAPPPLPVGYNIYPGIGYYKYHEAIHPFDDAKKVCENEGGHLAIPDSTEEGEVLKKLVRKEQTFIGADDRATEGKFMTVLGMPMNDVIAWNTNQPDNSGGKEHCVTILTIGTLNDVPCDHRAPFICEFDLQWAD